MCIVEKAYAIRFVYTKASIMEHVFTAGPACPADACVFRRILLGMAVSDGSVNVALLYAFSMYSAGKHTQSSMIIR